MEDHEPTNPTERRSVRKILFGWPITLAALTAALLFFASRVSAWHRGHGDDPARARAHAVRVLDHLLEDLETNADQKARIHTLASEIFDELERARSVHSTDGAAWRELVAAETIDAGSLEALRRGQLDRADALTRVVLARFTAILEVLSPAQRRALIERIEAFRGLHGHAGRHAGRHARRAFHRAPEGLG